MKVDCVIRTERFDERRVTTTKAIRLDSIPLDKTYYTEEGYLVDHPILTSCGIFEYANPDGSIRRELRLPEEVFNDKSLESYEGKPIIVTHDAGEVNKDNAHRETIGTILSKGYRDGDDVRAKIIIHDARVLYDQLKIVSDHLIATKRVIACSILDHNIGYPVAKEDDKNYCGGSGGMLAFDVEGKAYPCLRYCPISIGKEKAEKICIGDMQGIYNTPHTAKIRDYLDAITLSSQSTPECINCPVGVGCGWCSAYNYESTGDVNRRVTNICWAHKGRTLASCYYHNKRYLELRDTTPKAVLLPEKDALQIIPREEYEYLLRLQTEAEKVFLKEGGEDGI